MKKYNFFQYMGAIISSSSLNVLIVNMCRLQLKLRWIPPEIQRAPTLLK